MPVLTPLRGIARGGFGVVWACRENGDGSGGGGGTVVAVKQAARRDVVTRRQEAHVSREARVGCRLRVAGGAVRCSSDDAFLYSVAPFLPGGTLDAVCRRRDAAPPPDALEPAARLLAAALLRQLVPLAAAGCAHRDVAPSNVLVNAGAPAGAVLADYGLVTRVVAPSSETRSPAPPLPPPLAPDSPVGAALAALVAASAPCCACPCMLLPPAGAAAAPPPRHLHAFHSPAATVVHHARVLLRACGASATAAASASAGGGGGRRLSTAGTGGYVAPEAVLAPAGSGDVVYDATCDVWSLGALLWAVLFGAPPFGGDDDVESAFRVSRRAAAGLTPAQEAALAAAGVTPACAAFITACLVPTPSTRPRAAQLAAHAWFTTALHPAAKLADSVSVLAPAAVWGDASSWGPLCDDTVLHLRVGTSLALGLPPAAPSDDAPSSPPVPRALGVETYRARLPGDDDDDCDGDGGSRLYDYACRDPTLFLEFAATGRSP